MNTGYKVELMQLQHTIGFNSAIKNSLYIHPNNTNYIYIVGSIIIVAEMNDPNKQERLIGHDDYITSIALSYSGDLIATGQKGENSDVLVWDFNLRKRKFMLSEHDYEVTCLAFSKDEKLLFSCGNIYDKNIFIWDMANGYNIY
jgi:WD40 repeat protein